MYEIYDKYTTKAPQEIWSEMVKALSLMKTIKSIKGIEYHLVTVKT